MTRTTKKTIVTTPRNTGIENSSRFRTYFVIARAGGAGGGRASPPPPPRRGARPGPVAARRRAGVDLVLVLHRVGHHLLEDPELRLLPQRHLPGRVRLDPGPLDHVVDLVVVREVRVRLLAGDDSRVGGEELGQGDVGGGAP